MAGGKGEDFEEAVNRKLRVRPEAEADVQEAYWWYERQADGLGLEFLRAVDACLASIERYPTGYPKVHGDARRALLRRFPYGVLYLVEEREIVVLACSHTRLDPRTWQQRG